MLFNFELTPLDDVAPWGSDGDRYLGWFILTDGRYWVRVGQSELFRSSDAILSRWGEQYPDSRDTSPYVDYYVVRLWEDILEVLPSWINPVPDDLAVMLQSKRASLSDILPRRFELDTEGELWEAAMRWWLNRRLTSYHLKHSPRIAIWTGDGTTHITWDNRGLMADDVPVWAAQQGAFQIPVADFVAEIQSFNDRLLNAMEARIAEIKRDWKRADIRIDIEQLDAEQIDRRTWLPNKLQRPEYVDWNETRLALARYAELTGTPPA
jgi:hypothetical protein